MAERSVVEGDRQRMKQILMIVLDNAVKYSRREGVVVLAVEEQAGEAVVTVRNRSEHVNAGELPRVFDRFYRGRDAAAAGSAGSGLGLSIARWMTEKQGGSIALVRSEADWIEVCLRFPLVGNRQAGGAARLAGTGGHAGLGRVRGAASEGACQKCCWWRTMPASPDS